jgi:carbon starvation protein CstA
LQEYVAKLPTTANKAAEVVNLISREWLGTVGGFLALLGVIAAPITSGDTALRSARLIAADFLHLDQKPIKKRLLVSIPIFVLTFVILTIDFDILWRYFAWCNQTLSVFTLWAITVYLAKRNRLYIITLLPAMFMTCVSVSYILIANEGFGLPYGYGLVASLVVTISFLLMFCRWQKKRDKNGVYD